MNHQPRLTTTAHRSKITKNGVVYVTELELPPSRDGQARPIDFCLPQSDLEAAFERFPRKVRVTIEEIDE
jgi:hypothetical protein